MIFISHWDVSMKLKKNYLRLYETESENGILVPCGNG